MTRFALTIEYDGGLYVGWQRQELGATVQGAIEEAINKVTGEQVAVHGAGRTDAVVHARGMRAHCDIQKNISAFRLTGAINAHLLPQPISVIGCEIAAEDWHARYSCTGRAYEYRIVNRRPPLALERGKAWRIGPKLDAGTMHEAAQTLVGAHDFTTFRSTHCQSASPVKTLDRLDVRREGEFIVIEAAALSFLHHQVRSMVGCLAAVGRGRWSASDLQLALDAKDRAALAENAPPDGLYFMRATYL